MLIGHLPSGYIAGKTALKKWRIMLKEKRYKNSLLSAAIIGAICPDFDMFYFYLIDNRQHHHHSYWSHFPIVWFTLLLAVLLWRKCSKNIYNLHALLFTLCAILHLILDSIVGDIWWLAPFIDKPFALFTVPALYQPWWLNFIFHWSFLLEIAIIFWAFFLFFSPSFSQQR